MNGELTAFLAPITITVLEEKWDTLVFEPLRHQGPLDEDTRDYLREKASIESKIARRLFAEDDC